MQLFPYASPSGKAEGSADNSQRSHNPNGMDLVGGLMDFRATVAFSSCTCRQVWWEGNTFLPCQGDKVEECWIHNFGLMETNTITAPKVRLILFFTGKRYRMEHWNMTLTATFVRYWASQIHRNRQQALQWTDEIIDFLWHTWEMAVWQHFDSQNGRFWDI